MVRTTTDDPAEGDTFKDTIDGDTKTVESVEDDDRVVNELITFDDGEAVTSDEFHDRIERGTLAPVEDKRVDPDDVDFDAHAIAAAWEAGDDVPVCVAVAVTNQFHDLDVKALEGYKTDGDVGFWEDPEDGTPVVLFEEKAVGVCPRETAEKFAPMFVDLPNRDDDKVLAVNPAQIFN